MNILAHLGFQGSIHRLGYKDIKQEILPLIRINKFDIIKFPDDLEGFTGKEEFISVERIERENRVSIADLRSQIKRFSPLIRESVALSIIIGALALAPIFYNRAIYDHVIASGSGDGTWTLLTGVIAALAADIGLRQLRNRRLAFLGGRIDHNISLSIFERILYLSPVYTERSSTSAQMARLRDFESIREFFTSPLAALFFEFPVIFIYWIAMCFIAGWLALVPLGLILSYAILILTLGRRLKEDSKTTANLSTKKQDFLLETVTKLRAIRLAGLEKKWNERYRLLSAQASYASFKSAYSAQLLEIISYVLMTAGGIMTLGFGVVMVINQDMTVGALIASMMLIWRIISPAQILCASLTRVQQLWASSKQVEKLLSVPPETRIKKDSYVQNISGSISFHRVSLKYSQETEPALLGVSFDIKPGQIVAIKGNNGSGKSTILKLIMGLYQPQSGSIRINGVDIRQFDPFYLRQNIAYVPQTIDFFPGTIRDNLIYSYPMANDEDIRAALQDAQALEEIESLPDRMDSFIDIDNYHLVSYSLRQKLNLARAYIRPSHIYLFDEAAYSLGYENDISFAKKIKTLSQNKATVILATHREDHMKMADQLFVMNKGEMTHAGPPEQVLLSMKGRKL